MSNQEQKFTVLNAEFRPSAGQQFQLAGMFREAAESFKCGDIGMCIKKLEKAQEWAIRQVGVMHE